MSQVALQPPALAHSDGAREHATRLEILRLVLSEGPICAAQLAQTLGLAQAGIRRHLSLLESRGLIAEYQARTLERGRGRPARYFVASEAAHQELADGAQAFAVDVLAYLRQTAGPEATRGYAQHRAGALASRYATQVGQAGSRLEDRAKALATALNEDGFAASLRPGPGNITMQLCLGHCPIHQVAAAYPEICEAETAAIAELLGIHVQRLATLARGHHVCTTNLPLGVPAETPVAAATNSHLGAK